MATVKNELGDCARCDETSAHTFRRERSERKWLSAERMTIRVVAVIAEAPGDGSRILPAAREFPIETLSTDFSHSRAARTARSSWRLTCRTNQIRLAKGGYNAITLPSNTDLVYNIVKQMLLTGTIDEITICARAGSGGRAGTKTPGALHELLANNPYTTRVRKAGKRPGGPLPRARYKLSTHEARPNWIRLTPLLEDRRFLHGRAGFAVHGRGPWGSDGCIVPMDFPVVRLL